MRPLDEPLEPEDKEANVIPFENRRADTVPPQAIFSKLDVEDLQARWDAVQASFIDEPSGAVTEADKLVCSAVQQISQAFASQREQLEKQWNRGGDISTEDLRITLQRYRSFFSRLLSM
jgi:hypothetical protein